MVAVRSIVDAGSRLPAEVVLSALALCPDVVRIVASADGCVCVRGGVEVTLSAAKWDASGRVSIPVVVTETDWSVFGGVENVLRATALRLLAAVERPKRGRSR